MPLGIRCRAREGALTALSAGWLVRLRRRSRHPHFKLSLFVGGGYGFRVLRVCEAASNSASYSLGNCSLSRLCLSRTPDDRAPAPAGLVVRCPETMQILHPRTRALIRCIPGAICGLICFALVSIVRRAIVYQSGWRAVLDLD